MGKDVTITARLDVLTHSEVEGMVIDDGTSSEDGKSDDVELLEESAITHYGAFIECLCCYRRPEDDQPTQCDECGTGSMEFVNLPKVRTQILFAWLLSYNGNWSAQEPLTPLNDDSDEDKAPVKIL